MTSNDKIKSLIKYCIGYKKANRTNKCARIIGRSLAECEATTEDVKVARMLLKILLDEN